MKNKIILIVVIFLTALILGGAVYSFLKTKNEPVTCTMETKLCLDGSYVGHAGPNCEFAACPGEKQGILVSSPKTNEKIKSPFKIEGQAQGFWFFEAQFTAELYDANNNFLGRAILTAKDDWMTENFVPFEGELVFQKPVISLGTLKFLSANPSGLPEHQRVFEAPIQFEAVPYKKVLLYYYNSEKDKDGTDNIKCSRGGLVVVEREIPVTKTPIQDTINLLLKGKENLSEKDIAQGITTEYPLAGFFLLETNFKEDGTLILRFNDLQNKTSGGSCRVGILWFQIEATAKQFPEVRQVRFLPEEIFQP